MGKTVASEAKTNDYSRIIIDIAQDMIVAVDGNRGICTFNKAAEEVYGYPFSEVAGQPVAMLYASDSEAQRVGREMMAHGQFRGEVMSRRKDGSVFPSRIVAKLLKNDRGENIGSVGYSRDLTAEREAAAVKREYASLLELDRLKKDVEHITRHDMKSPLNGVIGLADLLLIDPGLNENHRELIQTIRDSGNKALRMVNLALDVLKMEQGHYQLVPRPVDLVPILRDIESANGSQIRIKELDVRLRIDASPMEAEGTMVVIGEESICYNLFANLFKNAVEASPPRRPLTVDMIHDGDRVRIDLRNHGVVPKEIRQRFFDKYVTAGKKTGTGLGTHSAKLMAETLGGNIRLETFDEAGTTTITVHLPGGD